MTEGLTASDVAARAGVDASFVDRLVELEIIAPSDGAFGETDVRKVAIVLLLQGGGLPVPELGQALRGGMLTLDFADHPAYERFASMSDVTFRDVSVRTNVPLEVLLVIREAMGGAPAKPDDLMREDELAVVPMLEFQCRVGVQPATVERALRTMGESVRRMAETEADWWGAELMGPLIAQGKTAKEVSDLSVGWTEQQGPTMDAAIIALFHGQQANAWMRNIFGIAESVLVGAGLHSPSEAVPAMCFLDLTGYSRLTDERGDKAAAELAGRLSRMVQRSAATHGGKAVKWLGDGVMFYFPEPGRGVLAALEMVDEARTAGMPPAHVGLHAGPVLFQGGDYFGRTVNGASRIGDYARQGEVLVSQQVVDASTGFDLAFLEIGPVELKGLGDALRLYIARRTAT